MGYAYGESANIDSVTTGYTYHGASLTLIIAAFQIIKDATFAIRFLKNALATELWTGWDCVNNEDHVDFGDGAIDVYCDAASEYLVLEFYLPVCLEPFVAPQHV